MQIFKIRLEQLAQFIDLTPNLLLKCYDAKKENIILKNNEILFFWIWFINDLLSNNLLMID